MGLFFAKVTIKNKCAKNTFFSYGAKSDIFYGLNDLEKSLLADLCDTHISLYLSFWI